jgi:hypothetical protein
VQHIGRFDSAGQPGSRYTNRARQMEQRPPALAQRIFRVRSEIATHRGYRPLQMRDRHNWQDPVRLGRDYNRAWWGRTFGATDEEA